MWRLLSSGESDHGLHGGGWRTVGRGQLIAEDTRPNDLPRPGEGGEAGARDKAEH